MLEQPPLKDCNTVGWKDNVIMCPLKGLKENIRRYNKIGATTRGFKTVMKMMQKIYKGDGSLSQESESSENCYLHQKPVCNFPCQKEQI